jgi:hypothetical protein
MVGAGKIRTGAQDWPLGEVQNMGGWGRGRVLVTGATIMENQKLAQSKSSLELMTFVKILFPSKVTF